MLSIYFPQFEFVFLLGHVCLLCLKMTVAVETRRSNDKEVETGINLIFLNTQENQPSVFLLAEMLKTYQQTISAKTG